LSALNRSWRRGSGAPLVRIHPRRKISSPNGREESLGEGYYTHLSAVLEVRTYMNSSEERRSYQDVEQWMHSKGASKCPLCRLEAWNFTETRKVIVVGASGASEIGREPQVSRGQDLTGILSAIRNLRSDLMILRSQLRVIRNAAQTAALHELKCGNCGYVVFLDAKIIAGRAIRRT